MDWSIIIILLAAGFLFAIIIISTAIYDTKKRRKKAKRDFNEAKATWENSTDADIIKAATDNWEEYSSQVQAIIEAESKKRGLWEKILEKDIPATTTDIQLDALEKHYGGICRTEDRMIKIVKYTVVSIIFLAVITTLATAVYYVKSGVGLCIFIGWFVHPYIIMIVVMWLFRKYQSILTVFSVGLAIITILGMFIFLDAVFTSIDAPIGLAIVPVCQLIAVFLLSIVCLILKKCL